jgi:hypothetical protein
MATLRLTTQMLEIWPQAGEDRAKLAAEGLVRLAISHAGLPTSPIEEAARSVGELIGPYLDNALAD